MRNALLWVALTLIYPIPAFALNVPDYLIDADIGQYSRSYPGACPKGSGIIAAAGHFKVDHIDYACDIRYYNETLDLGVSVQITQHAGSDSDKWLLHEVDKDYRTYFGISDPSYIIRNIEGNTIITFGAGGWNYRWISGNKVVMIEYHDSQMTKPEPLEIVKAYLTKHPPTMPATTMKQLLSAENKTIWIKDEMDRRLWLCDKWLTQIQTPDLKLHDKLKSMTDSMIVFVNYREKYFGLSAKDEKNLLAGYLKQNDSTNIQTKLAAYKTWWAANKGNAISLP
jgi:hypothetical protein